MTIHRVESRAAAADMRGNYWHEGVADHVPRPRDLKSAYDVVIVGGGYSGLSVASGLAEQGASVLLIEQHGIGFGASSRNGGMVGPSFHGLGLAGLTKAYGDTKARQILAMGVEAVDYCEDLLSKPDMDCDLRMSGRFRGARTEADHHAMIGECERLGAAVGLRYEIVQPSDIHLHTGSRAYVGGILYPRDGGLHPKKLANTLATRAEVNGATLLTQMPATSIHRDASGFLVRTPGEDFRARQVVIATNGYSDSRMAELHRRIVPIDVAVSATRHLGEERVRAMSPGLQMHGESGRIFIWSRPSPDHTRFIFGGRIASKSAPPDVQRAQIAAAVGRLFPDLIADDFQHVWHGKIAYTTDHSPHIAQDDGLWLIGGYCGSGVTRSLYFADKLVRKMTGQPGSATPLDDIEFPVVPFRSFAPFAARTLTRYYALRDRLDRLRKPI
ncbi:FAD-binding oxidoreductase [Tropicimonas sp. IMCC34011]|uniref:NAD(P)/FAD-dependent oxidoreductase n=1 Tax=Tropicimonas sp. IMCC34011 TaxID=2248759 RepID=UPI000E24DA39|nr:FAD-dependent oxidoreductase [Tropicimonas sp. IMCC34011]